MDPLVSQTEVIGHLEFSIRQHGGADPVSAVSLCELFRGVGADREDCDTALVEFGSQVLFPSPQLGDTVGSPVCAKELDEHRMPGQALGVEGLSVLVGGREVGDRAPDADGTVADLLPADREGK